MNPYRKIYIRVNTKCNQNCINCVIKSSYKNNNLVLNPEKLRKSLEKIEFNQDTDIFKLTGGEPTIHPEFHELLKVIRGIFKGEVILLTNGFLIGNKNGMERILKYINSSTISFYSFSESISYKITGVKGSLIAKIKALKKFSDNNINIYSKLLITKPSYKKLPEMVEFLISKNDKVSSVNINVIHLINNAWKNRDYLAISYNKATPFVEKAADKFEEYGIMGSLVYPMCLLDPFYWQYIPVGFGEITLKSLAIEPNGKIYRAAKRLTEFLYKPRKCLSCVLKERCYWPHQGYIKHYGDEILTPISYITE